MIISPGVSTDLGRRVSSKILLRAVGNTSGLILSCSFSWKIEGGVFFQAIRSCESAGIQAICTSFLLFHDLRPPLHATEWRTLSKRSLPIILPCFARETPCLLCERGHVLSFAHVRSCPGFAYFSCVPSCVPSGVLSRDGGRGRASSAGFPGRARRRFHQVGDVASQAQGRTFQVRNHDDLRRSGLMVGTLIPWFASHWQAREIVDELSFA